MVKNYGRSVVGRLKRSGAANKIYRKGTEAVKKLRGQNLF